MRKGSRKAQTSASRRSDYFLEHLLDIRDIQVHIPCFSGVEDHMCLKEVPLSLGSCCISLAVRELTG